MIFRLLLNSKKRAEENDIMIETNNENERRIFEIADIDSGRILLEKATLAECEAFKSEYADQNLMIRKYEYFYADDATERVKEELEQSASQASIYGWMDY